MFWNEFSESSEPFLRQRLFVGMNALHDKMLKVLVAAQDHRKERGDMVPSNNPREKYPEIGWVVYERQVMFDAVNEERKSRGLEPVGMEEVVRVETTATGHVDYTRKFALYCAELVLDNRPIQP